MKRKCLVTMFVTQICQNQSFNPGQLILVRYKKIMKHVSVFMLLYTRKLIKTGGKGGISTHIPK